MRLRFDEALRCVREAGIESILDVGCGPGRYIASFADAGVRVTGIDLADGMIVRMVLMVLKETNLLQPTMIEA